MKRICLLLIPCILALGMQAQTFTKQDSLRGSITPERAWWDLKHYTLNVQVFPEQQSIKGTNTITYEVLESGKLLQIDLQAPMILEKVLQNGKELDVTSEGNAHFIHLKKTQKKGTEQQLELFFSGTPRVAKNPPWDGGFTWSKDSNGTPFIANSNQGIGASIWWPNKDHPYDEPDQGIDLTIEVPNNLVAVGNGRLMDITDHKQTKKYHWKVVNPINNYGVNVNIGDYANFSEVYKGLKGDLKMDYWVLQANLEKAKEHFKQAPMMMEAFEHWFGPYPFYEDSFKLVEAPYLGMEHQSSVTYGNKYMNGYLGRDLSQSGWGLKFDFLIIHESGHEWFANNITNRDVADMWIHEGFTAYSENLFLNYFYGKEASSEYVVGTKKIIMNDRPVIGTYDVNHEGSSDMYYKGSNILHTLRQLIEDDEKWRSILVGLNRHFYHQTISSEQLEQYISEKSGIDLTEFWEQYLRTTDIPLVEYSIEGADLKFRYTHIVENFDMPVIMLVNGKEEWIFPTAEWNTKSFPKPIETVVLKSDFLVNAKEM